jgi:ribosomal protein S8
MTRLSLLVATMRSGIKQGATKITVPSNKLCFAVLSLLRSRGIIVGFRETIYPSDIKGHTSFKGFPRVTVYLKYTASYASVLKDIKAFRHTKNNYYLTKKVFTYTLTDPSVLFIVSGPTGLYLTGPKGLQERKKESPSVLCILHI